MRPTYWDRKWKKKISESSTHPQVAENGALRTELGFMFVAERTEHKAIRFLTWRWICCPTSTRFVTGVQRDSVLQLYSRRNFKCLHTPLFQNHQWFSCAVGSHVLNPKKVNMKCFRPKKSLQLFRPRLVYQLVFNSLVSGTKCGVDIFISIHFILVVHRHTTGIRVATYALT